MPRIGWVVQDDIAGSGLRRTRKRGTGLQDLAASAKTRNESSSSVLELPIRTVGIFRARMMVAPVLIGRPTRRQACEDVIGHSAMSDLRMFRFAGRDAINLLTNR